MIPIRASSYALIVDGTDYRMAKELSLPFLGAPLGASSGLAEVMIAEVPDFIPIPRAKHRIPAIDH